VHNPGARRELLREATAFVIT